MAETDREDVYQAMELARPYSSGALAEEMGEGISRRTVHRKLELLHAAGRVERYEVSGRVVWMVAECAECGEDPRGGGDPNGHEHAQTAAAPSD